jgi:ABC-type Zn uptake system ZnuABC Zn-binding protein ZnuA
MTRMTVLVAAVLAVAACGGKKDAGGGAGGSAAAKSDTSSRSRVAVSIFPLFDVTRRIAGDKLDVVLVLPAGKSEHSFDPSPREIAELDGVKLGIAVGLDMDTWIEMILKNVGNPKVVHLGDKVTTMPINTRPIGADPDDKDPDEVIGAPDPHVWMDPDRMSKMADAIAVELGALDPADKDVFVKNAGVVKDSLAKLDAAIAARTKAWSKHTIVTFHGSMSYFAKRYGITIAAVVEPIAGKEPTAAYINSVLAAIKASNAAAIFTEPQFERAPGETISKEGNLPLGELDPVGGVPGRDSYEALITWDADQMEKVLK